MSVQLRLPINKNSMPSVAGSNHSHALQKVMDAKTNLALEVRRSKNTEVKKIIRELVNLKNDHQLSDDEFKEVMEAVVSNYIESEVTLRISDLLRTQLSGVFFKYPWITKW